MTKWLVSAGISRHWSTSWLELNLAEVSAWILCQCDYIVQMHKTCEMSNTSCCRLIRHSVRGVFLIDINPSLSRDIASAAAGDPRDTDPAPSTTFTLLSSLFSTEILSSQSVWGNGYWIQQRSTVHNAPNVRMSVDDFSGMVFFPSRWQLLTGTTHCAKSSSATSNIFDVSSRWYDGNRSRKWARVITGWDS